MVYLFSMFQHILFVKQHILKLTLNVPVGLVGEMFGGWIEGLPAGDNGFRFYTRAKFHGGNKTVAGVAITLFCIHRPALEGWQLPKSRVDQADREAWRAI